MKHIAWLIALVLTSTVAFAKTEEKPCEAAIGAEYASVNLAATRFRTFFKEIENGLFEREFFLDISKLGLLANEHVLMLGPPGNAKSMGVDMIINNIVDESTRETSVFKIQMTPETSLSETHGVIDYKKITEENIQTRMWEQGMLSARLVFIDEFFDARANAIRNTLMALNEREHAQGRERIQGVTETAWAASNKYINEVYDKAGDDGPKASIDRFAFVAFVPGEMDSLESAIRLITEFKPKQPEKMTFQELDQLRAKVNQVEIPPYVAQMLSVMFMRMKDQTESLEESEKKRFLDQRKAGLTPLPPYRATKYYTPRTLRKAGKILRAIVINDWIEKEGARPLRANSEDIAQLLKFFTMNSQGEDFLRRMEESTVNPNEKVQIMSALKEREMFNEIYAEILTHVNERATILIDLEYERENAITQGLKEAASKKILETFLEQSLAYVPTASLRETSESDIAAGYVLSTLEMWLRDDLGDRFDEVVESTLKSLLKERDRKIAEERRAEELRLKKEEEARQAEERRLRLLEEARQARLAEFVKTRETLQAKPPQNILQWGGNISAVTITNREDGIVEIFGLDNLQPRLSEINLKTGKIVRDKHYNHQERISDISQVVRLENGDYLLWTIDGTVRTWNTAKGRMGAITNLELETYHQTRVSSNAPGNKVLVRSRNEYHDNKWKFAVLNASVPSPKLKWIEEDAFTFENPFPNLDAPTHFLRDIDHPEARFILAPNGKTAILSDDESNSGQAIKYEINLVTKKIKVLSWGNPDDFWKRWSTEFSQYFVKDTELHGEMIDGKVVFQGKEKIQTELTHSVRSMMESQNLWDVAPDGSYAITKNSYYMYGVDFTLDQTFDLNFQPAVNGAMRFLDQHHLIFFGSNGLQVFRLPTAGK